MAFSNQKFIVKNTLLLFINENVNTIELCLGDITELDAERNKVDLILISAFPGDYGGPAGSVMNALQTNLNIDVQKLAKDKAVDRVATHKCWWSKPLHHANVPYRRLMCYESGPSEATAAEFTSTAFACVKEIFVGKDCTMVTSLLNTGNQKMDPVVMLEAIVEGAINAMNQGLKLRQLMIFINAKVSGEASYQVKLPDGKDEEVYSKFEALKQKYSS